MGKPLPDMTEFRAEMGEGNVLHLIFDMPGRSMNVFTNKAILEIEAFAHWLADSDLKGVVVRSGKASAFCAGADLGELGLAYDMIVTAPKTDRKRIAREHFAPIGRAFRKLETAGKPVAAAINGLALGGGCEFVLGCHYRVMADTPQTALGLPESLVGLLPGGGGTQRMPRLVGLHASWPILLDGARLNPREALSAGAVDEVVPAGEEVAAAERWVLSAGDPRQPWDRDDWQSIPENEVSRIVAPVRSKVLADTGGHVPAPLAILDCIERGLPLPMDTALQAEGDIFADLINRPEPRNMIQTLFLGKQDFEKRRRVGAVPDFVRGLLGEVAQVLANAEDAPKQQAGFVGAAPLESPSANWNRREGIWYEAPESDGERQSQQLMRQIAEVARPHAATLSEDEKRLVDYAAVKELGFPAYAGGPFAMLARLAPTARST